MIRKHRLALRSPSGTYTFFSRNDSLYVQAPHRPGRPTLRYVGQGVPVMSTTNGEYLLAVHRTPSGPRAIIYYFRLFHAMMKTSCDR